MYKEAKMQNLFDSDNVSDKKSNEIQAKTELPKLEIDYHDDTKSKSMKDSAFSPNRINSEVVKIVWFYENNSFEEFFPRR
jgi:hypothetical protein